jgi:tRNA threonylcarbamoyladenosine biosynthesis protein TsaB
MNFLAIESSTDRISLALSNERQIVTRELPGDLPRASEVLVTEIGSLLESVGVPRNALHGVAYDRGPGAFTSIRCGCAVAKAIALADGIPVIGVPSLEALAHALPDADRICCALDARMGEVYVARFRRSDGVLLLVGEMECLSPSALRLVEDGWVGIGTGFSVADGAIGKANPGRLSAVFPDVWPSASAICELALQRYAAGVRGDAAEAAPLYVRDKVALTTLERQQARA